jgi:hypothetical protein
LVGLACFPRSGRLLPVVFLISSVMSVVSARPVSAATTNPSIGVDHDQLGTSWYDEQAGLNSQLVTGGSFGQLFATQLQGLIQNQPLVDANTLLVSTEANDAYGLNAATGAVLWTKSFGTTFSSNALGCADLPSVGVTGTPVVDQATNTEFLLSKTYVSGTAGPGAYWMHALDVSTGQERTGFPVQIAGVAANDSHQSFNATYQLQRPGLVLLGGVVYAAFGGHCDLPPTHGWITGVSEAGKLTTLWSDEAGADTGSQGLGGIWAPGALRSDGPGQLIFASGNGDLPTTPIPGSTPPPQLAMSVSRLSVQADGSLKATDFFMPWDSPNLDQIDGDLGSGSPVLLPPAQFSTAKYPHLAIEIGKEGYLYVLNADDLGGYKQGVAGGDQVIARLGPVQGVWGSPAVWGGDGGYLYFVTNGGSGGPGSDGHLLAWKFGVDGNGTPTFAQVGTSTDTFAYGGSAPVMTSSGTTSGTGILWVNWAGGEGTTHGQLRAYNPIPVNGQLQQIWSAPSGAAVRLTQPGVGGNRVYSGGYDGVIRGFGAPVENPLSGGAVSFPNTTVGTSSTTTATFTATRPLTVTAISISGGSFKLGSPAPALPVALDPGAPGNTSVSVPVTFTPTAPTASGATITVTTSAGPYGVGASGDGLSATALLTVAPFAVSFEGTAIGSVVTDDVIFTNAGAQPLHFTGASPPGAPFSSDDLPAVGTALAPGASVSVDISIKPTASGEYVDALTVSSDTGGSATVNLSGTSGTSGQLAVAPVNTDYGNVALGSTVDKSFAVSNIGGTAITITKSKPPSLNAFHAVGTLAEGTTIQPGQVLTETVAFTPTSAVVSSDRWVINGSGVSTLTDVAFSGTGVAAPPPALLGPPAAGGWKLRGAATMSRSTLVLNPFATNQAGSDEGPVAVATDGLRVSFDAMINGNTTGADGMTLALADPSSTTFLGGTGGALGYCGIKGVAVALVTYKNAGEPSSNFVGVSGGCGSGGVPTFAATSTNIPALQNATTGVSVSISGHQLTVSVAGVQVLQTTVAALPAQADLIFTGSTGGLDDSHAVGNVTITQSVLPPPAAGAWTLRGNATLSGSTLVLNPFAANQGGSDQAPEAVGTEGLTVSFDALINGAASGADGMTLTLADPASTTFLGGTGGALGYCGIKGVAVALVTYKNAGEPSSNFVGVAGACSAGIPAFTATSTKIPALQNATTHVVVSIAGQQLTVAVAGVQVLQVTMAGLTAQATLVFTGATGGVIDSHAVNNVTATATT